MTSLKMNQTGLARVAEACQYLGVSRGTLYRLMAAGELPSTKIGKCRRVPWDALHALVQRKTG